MVKLRGNTLFGAVTTLTALGFMQIGMLPACLSMT
jgi:hypothetical protein